MKWKLSRKSKAITKVPTTQAPLQFNFYFETVSARLGILQVILYLSLFSFVVLSFLRNTDLITYRNFYYFFKDLNASAETVDLFETDSISYPTAEEQSFALWRQGLAVAGNDSLTVFTATGRQTLSRPLQYRNPIAVGTGKYLMVYELGGTQYSVYNSYTRLYTGKSDYPIYGATVSESGSYALISRSEQYNSIVSLYNDNFVLLNRYNRNGYVTDVALNSKGTRLAILTAMPEDGLLSTSLSIYVPREAGEGNQVTLTSSIGLSCAFTDTNEINVLCRDGLYSVTDGGEIGREQLFAGREIICAELTEEGATVVLRESPVSQESTVLIYDKSAKLLHERKMMKMVTQVSRRDGTVFLLREDGVDQLRLRGAQLTGMDCATNGKTILAVNGDYVLLCSPQKAEYLRFSS